MKLTHDAKQSSDERFSQKSPTIIISRICHILQIIQIESIQVICSSAANDVEKKFFLCLLIQFCDGPFFRFLAETITMKIT